MFTCPICRGVEWSDGVCMCCGFELDEDLDDIDISQIDSEEGGDLEGIASRSWEND